MKIQTKIFSLIFFLILATGIVATTTTYLVSKQMIESEIYHHLETTAISRAHHIETLLDEEAELVKIFAIDSVFIEALTTENITPAIQKIKILINIHEDISRIRVLDKQGNMVVSSHSKIDAIDNAEIFAYGKEGVYIHEMHISTMTGTKVISLSAPILVKGEFAGIIIVNIEVEEELYKILSLGCGKSSEIYLINKYGYMITPSRFIEDTFLKLKINSLKAKECLKRYEKEPETEQAKIDIYENYRDKLVIGTYYAIENTNWCLLVEIEAEEALAPVNKLVQLIILFLILLLGVSSLLAFFTAKNITCPILKLHRRAEEIEKGNWDYQGTVDTQDEIGRFSNAFDSMTARLKNAQDELRRYQEKQAEQIAERTAELSQRIQDIERQKIGMQNLALDLEETNRQLTLEIAERKQAEEKAYLANRAKSEFLANMSHEIRTPMNAVIGFSDILASKVTDKKQKSYLNSIQMAGKSLLTLINDILDLSKIEAGRLDIHYEPANPQIIFTELQQIFSLKIAEKNLEWIMDIDETLPPALFLDETRLRQVLLNLIGNAIKFTETGYVKVCAHKKYTEDDHSQINLILAVEDTGIGIPTDQQALIFKSFRQQDGQSTRQYGGTGLGLAITKRLVEMMNGVISVESLPGEGSRFEITLQRMEIATTVQEVKQDNTFDINNITFAKVQVLVVDDVESNRNLIQEYLSQVNLSVISAENGHKALLFAEEYHPVLILMDIKMPEMDGYEVIKHLKYNPNTADIPIIALTASVTLNEKAKCKAHGFDSYLSKPINISELLSELSHFLKYTKKVVTNVPQVATTAVDNTPNLADIADIPALRNKLEQEIMPLWEKANIMMEMDIVAELAEKMIELGKEYNIPVFIHYGEPLLESTQTFNITYIQKALNEFPVLVKPVLVKPSLGNRK